MSAQSIYPDDFAKTLLARAGQKYRPSNGTEDECFFEAWRCQCARDKAMREGVALEDCDDNERCDIIALSFLHDVDHPDYPDALQYGKDGQPRCTRFVQAGDPIPPEPDTHTIDMFDDLAAKDTP